ncbi:MAG: hypothetical protein U5K71_02385 [Gracilimonas sp.]|nr:hypothetical protein [Gracilimonas sp.]
MRVIIGVLLFTTVLLGCNNLPTSVSPEIGEPFKIKLGQSLEFQNEALNVRFEEMLEDSRCPEGATCFWAGNARIIIQLNDLKTELNTYLDPKITDISDFTVELISLTPYPNIIKKIDKDEYTAELRVLRN